MVKDAADNIAKFESLEPDQRRRFLDEGNLDYYTPENVAKRLALFYDDLEINMWLDKWWSAVETFVDKDHNDVLTKGKLDLIRISFIIQELCLLFKMNCEHTR